MTKKNKSDPAHQTNTAQPPRGVAPAQPVVDDRRLYPGNSAGRRVCFVAAPVSEARLADDPSSGSPTAKVTIVEYGDFGCPSCRAWHRAGILDQVRAKYGDQVRFVWRDFPVITPQSPKAAEAAQCAYTGRTRLRAAFVARRRSW